MFSAMMVGWKFRLNNTDFEINTATVLRNLYTNKNLTDVTLACEDGKQLRAHKIILSGASSVFDKILTDYSDSNPIIYFCDTTYEHLEYTLRFVYLGEVAINENEMKPFMETINKFRINGLYEEEHKNVAYFDNTHHANREEKSIEFIKVEDDTTEKPLFKDSKKDMT